MPDVGVELQEEYSDLAKKCMDFAVSCIDLCRTSDEVHCLLRGDFDQSAQELKHPLETVKIAIHSREKKEEYSDLAKKCMDFAVSCIDLCRTSDEVHCLLRGDFDQSAQELKHPLETVKIAIHSREKKVIIC
ncbi:hypothetical protein AHF37_11953 [Paragonimus kellicotti]|nr:hypothetical protein AHF37_11953 [Paragonimus kellicotti]